MLEKAITAEFDKRKRFVAEMGNIVNLQVFQSEATDLELTGNAVLFVSEDTQVSPEEIEGRRVIIPKVYLELEQEIRASEGQLEATDPLRIQLKKFLETIVQMSQRIMTESTSHFKTDSLSTSRRRLSEEKLRKDDNHELIKAYEGRIKNLERLLHENYVAAHKIDHESTDLKIPEEAGNLARNNLTSQAEAMEWKQAVDQIYDKLGLGPAPSSTTEAARLIISGYKESSALAEQLFNTLQQRVAFGGFEVGNIALLLPTVRKGIWSLFNVDCPNFYVHLDSLKIMLDDREKHSWFLARIQKIESKKSLGKTLDPYKLPKDFEYYEVVATKLS
jgi:hypothetical protein